MEAIKTLSKYGAVKTCKIVNEQVVTIVLTTGFTTNAMSSIEFLKTSRDLFPDYPKIETCVTEENCAIVILTK